MPEYGLGCLNCAGFWPWLSIASNLPCLNPPDRIGDCAVKLTFTRPPALFLTHTHTHSHSHTHTLTHSHTHTLRHSYSHTHTSRSRPRRGGRTSRPRRRGSTSLRDTARRRSCRSVDRTPPPPPPTSSRLHANPPPATTVHATIACRSKTPENEPTSIVRSRGHSIDRMFIMKCNGSNGHVVLF